MTDGACAMGTGPSSPRRLILAVLAACAVMLPNDRAQAFLDSINPFAETKDEFEGKFIDTLEPRVWLPPLERLARERQAADKARGARPAHARLGEEEDYEAPAAEPEQPAAQEPAPIKIADGLTLLRMSDEGVANTPVLETYLNGIGTRLLKASPIRDAPVRYYVTGAEDFGLI